MMKKLFSIFLLLTLAVFLAVGSAWATPIYNGEPLADFGSGVSGLPDSPLGPGYYIWANDAARTSWSIRWTGRDATTDPDTIGAYDWSGSIIFSNNEGIQDAITVSWETNDSGVPVVWDSGGSDTIMYGTAHAGPGWDGVDFTLTGVTGDYLTFNLYSSYFTTENDGVYIGQDMQSVLEHSDSAADFRSGTGVNRQFEIAAPVPEPTTILLSGIGLLGMGFYLRRKKTH